MWKNNLLLPSFRGQKIGRSGAPSRVATGPRRCRARTYLRVHLLDGGPAPLRSQQLSWLYVKLEMEVIKQPAEAKGGARPRRGERSSSRLSPDVLTSFRGRIRARVRVSAAERVTSGVPAPGREALGHAHPFILC